MINIRNNIFETNSSSTHSIAISSGIVGILDTIVPDDNGIIILNGGEFGWECYRYYDAITKANYAAVCSTYLKDNVKDMLIQVIKEHTGAKEVIFDINDDSYIDHQSIENGNHINGIFKSKESLKKLIFDPLSYIETSNDNGNLSFENDSLYDECDDYNPFYIESELELNFNLNQDQDPCDFCWLYEISNDDDLFSETYYISGKKSDITYEFMFLDPEDQAMMRYHNINEFESVYEFKFIDNKDLPVQEIFDVLSY